jgi:hypothetical protein
MTPKSYVLQLERNFYLCHILFYFLRVIITKLYDVRVMSNIISLNFRQILDMREGHIQVME